MSIKVYSGHIENGRVVLDNGVSLPEGAKVRVELELENESRSPPCESSEEGRENDMPSLYERMKHLAGIAKDLPPDFARNHDNYIHGAPKK